MQTIDWMLLYCMLLLSTCLKLLLSTLQGLHSLCYVQIYRQAVFSCSFLGAKPYTHRPAHVCHNTSHPEMAELNVLSAGTC